MKLLPGPPVGTYVPATGELTVTEAGTYRLSYAADSTVAVVSSVSAQVNGADVPGTASGGALGVASYNGEAIVDFAAGDVVTLHYTGAIAVAASINASMTIEKVA